MSSFERIAAAQALAAEGERQVILSVARTLARRLKQLLVRQVTRSAFTPS